MECTFFVVSANNTNICSYKTISLDSQQILQHVFGEFQSRMLLAPEVAAVIQDYSGKLGCHNDPRLLRSARSHARLVRQTLKIGLTALTLRPACVARRLLREEKRRPPPAHC